MKSNEEAVGFAPDCAQITMTTYASDVSGAASALYELGGMSVIHDASGCNSTYSTHDEPRWETMDSAVYVSALNEMDAVLGNESVLAQNLIDACRSLKPAFAMLAGTIIPMMTGSDLKGIAHDVEAATGVPAFALSTNGMRDYTVGAAQAWIELARRFAKAPAGRSERSIFSALRLWTFPCAANSTRSSRRCGMPASRRTPAGPWIRSRRSCPHARCGFECRDFKCGAASRAGLRAPLRHAFHDDAAFRRSCCRLGGGRCGAARRGGERKARRARSRPPSFA